MKKGGLYKKINKQRNENSKKKITEVEWVRISRPMQVTWFNSWSEKIPHAAEQLSPCATTTKPVL